MGKMVRNIVFGFFCCNLAQGVAAADSCPAVACDCTGLPSEAWRQECQKIEVELKASCIANQQVPKGFCGLHGPDARPLPLATQLNPVDLISLAPEIAVLEKQLSTAHWSLEDDLASLQKQLDAGNWSSLQAVAKLFDTHTDAAFVLLRQISASWLQLNRPGQAEDVAVSFAKKSRRLTENSQKLATAIWQMAKSAQGEDIRLRQSLAQRVLRTAGKLQEHQAFALAIRDQNAAARAWQDAARIAEQQVQLEMAGAQKIEYIAFYRQQASARWNRASLYWALAKNDNKAQEARRQAQEASTQVSATEN